MIIYSKTINSKKRGKIGKTKNNYFAFEINRSGEVKKVVNQFIINENIAKLRAIAEFLENGYDKQIVEFETYFVDVNINDIISIYAPNFRVPAELNKNRFIVKNVKHYFKNSELKTRIKAVRYD